jgi:glucuronokinase
MAVEAKAYARAGLVGNPSDGYFGKTLSIIVRNFHAKVTLFESDQVEIVPSYEDRPVFSSVRQLVTEIRHNGYYGGDRLMKAALSRFVEYCDANEIELHGRNFRLRYRSNIPRRVGLAGSSALITATLRCLMEFYEVSIPKPVLASLIWGVEREELGISAGLQDRVIQVYEGAVFMDFNQEHMEKHGYGVYTPVDPAKLPNLYIAYRTELAEGSEVFHNNIRERWLKGEPEVVQAMKDFATFAQAVYDLLEAGRGVEIGPWLDKNFNRRRSIYNLSEGDIDLVERARSVGASAKFAGSGGAIIGTYEDEAMFDALRGVFEDTHTELIKPLVRDDVPIEEVAS